MSFNLFFYIDKIIHTIGAELSRERLLDDNTSCLGVVRCFLNQADKFFKRRGFFDIDKFKPDSDARGYCFFYFDK